MNNPVRPKRSRVKVQTIQKNRKRSQRNFQETTEKPKAEKGNHQECRTYTSDLEPSVALADAAPRHPLFAWMHEPKTHYPTGGLLAAFKDTIPTINLCPASQRAGCDHPSRGQLDLNDLSNIRDGFGCVPVVLLIFDLITCTSGIPLSFIEKLATPAHFATVDHRHSRERAIDTQRDLQGELADRLPSGYGASCKNDEKSLQ